MKVLGLIDSFKGSLTSLELGKILKEELEQKGIQTNYIPISDGGDGFLDVLESIYKFKRINVNTVDSLFRNLSTYYLFDHSSNTAYIELAKSSGLMNLKPTEYNPFITSTYGTGLVILDAIKKGIKKIVLGIGGSSTNDGGAGILEALNTKFYDDTDNYINKLSNSKLGKLKNINFTEFNKLTKDIKFKVITDVTNPFLGSAGATYTFAEQKGANGNDLEILEENLENYANIVEGITKKTSRKLEGSGAAGGVGFIFNLVFNSEVIKGINYILDLIDFKNIKDNYDYIITGEGKVDVQSLSGKVVFEIAKLSQPKKVILLSAINELEYDVLSRMNIYKSYSIVDGITSKSESLKYPDKYFRKLVKGIEF